ncbi:MAG: BPL-N domain-containing protein [Thermodesulfovibrionales bacterium]|nr:BPL-N domain-containing protein [Thermodesulfovibrionales bacterium]
MNTNKAALLWDESFLWGLMAYKALKHNNLPFNLIRSQDIKAGVLKKYALLFVPGGWASNKLKALGNEGIAAIKEFVNKGGNYLGFCGGAGVATLDGIGLLNIKRKPTKERVPSFSGRIHLNIAGHPIWNRPAKDMETRRHGDTENSIAHSPIHPSTHLPVFHAWWPSQFLITDKNIKILATYGNALPDSFSSDLNVGDIKTNGDWHKLEKLYQINLDPKRLINEPAVVEGTFGKGKVILSLIHFDTPGDENGARVLKNLWKYLAEQESGVRSQKSEVRSKGFRTSELAGDIENAVDDLINLGIRNFLWYWRNPMLLQWRRGVRGLEYCTLYVMIKAIVEILGNQKSEVRSQKPELDRIKDLLIPFTEKAKQLLILERIAMQSGHVTYEKCNNPEIQRIRTELFSSSKSHGGVFKKLIDEIDTILYTLIKK